MKKEVSPLVGVVLILIALGTVQGLYWRGLLKQERSQLPEGRGGGGPAIGSAQPVGRYDVLVETAAGSGEAGYRDGEPTAALFSGPAAVAVGGSGTLYVADSRNNAIRTIGPGGRVSTVAGKGRTAGYADGAAADSRLSAPAGVAWMPDGSLLIADTGNHRLRRLSADGRLSTYGGAATETDDLGRELGGYRDGAAGQAQFRYPVGLAVDPSGVAYVADAGNGCVRRVSTNGEVTTVPVAGEASMQNPTGVCLTSNGSLWVTDAPAHALWTGPKEGPLRPWRGDVTGPGDGFAPSGIAAVRDTSGRERIYVADSAGGCLWLIDGESLALMAGQQNSEERLRDGGGDVARFSFPAGLASGPAGVFYVADFGNECIRRVTAPPAAKEMD